MTLFKVQLYRRLLAAGHQVCRKVTSNAEGNAMELSACRVAVKTTISDEMLQTEV